MPMYVKQYPIQVKKACL